MPDCRQRRASAAAQLDAIGWRFHFVDGDTPDSTAVRRLYSPPLNRRYAKRPLTDAEIAVYASHRRALRAFLDTNAEFGLILEDDFCLLDPSALPSRIAAVLEARVRWDVLKLFDFEARRVRERRRVGDVDIVNYAAPTAGMVAYLVTRHGAELILSRANLFRQIDEDTKYYWELSLRVYSLSPNLVVEISDRLGGSLLKAGREEMRRGRSLGRSMKGWWVVADRKLRHHWHKSEYTLQTF